MPSYLKCITYTSSNAHSFIINKDNLFIFFFQEIFIKASFSFCRNILTQIYNATRKWSDVCMTMWGRIIYLRHITQLITKNLRCTVSSVSTVRFTEF